MINRTPSSESGETADKEIERDSSPVNSKDNIIIINVGDSDQSRKLSVELNSEESEGTKKSEMTEKTTEPNPNRHINIKIKREDEIDFDSMRDLEFQDHVSDFAVDVQTPALEEPEISNISGSSSSLLNAKLRQSINNPSVNPNNLNAGNFVKKSNGSREYKFIHSWFGKRATK